jgi:hypothetical protein
VLRPDLGKAQQGIPWMTWDAPHDGHPYAPRLTRHVVDVLMVEHRAGVEPATASARLLNPPALHCSALTWTRLPDDSFEVLHETGVAVLDAVPVLIRRVGR